MIPVNDGGALLNVRISAAAAACGGGALLDAHIWCALISCCFSTVEAHSSTLVFCCFSSR